MKQKQNNTKFDHHDRMKHMSWCLKNGIKIYVKPIDYKYCKIVIEEDGIAYVGEHEYLSDLKKLGKKDKNWGEEIFKLYTDKYLENNGKLG